MPNLTLVIYCDDRGRTPFLEWFERLPERAQDKLVVRLERLSSLGHGLRRPEAEYLRDGIYELRVKHLAVNYRVLYFFHGRELVVLSHGFAKQQARVPEVEIQLALERKARFVKDPQRHTYEEREP